MGRRWQPKILFDRVINIQVPKGYVLKVIPMHWSREEGWVEGAVARNFGVARASLIKIKGPGDKDFTPTILIEEKLGGIYPHEVYACAELAENCLVHTGLKIHTTKSDGLELKIYTEIKINRMWTRNFPVFVSVFTKDCDDTKVRLLAKKAALKSEHTAR